MRCYSRRHHLKTKFGMSLEEYDARLSAQGGACAICSTTDPAPWDYFVVDHDHSTGEVRALLCHACNTVIGQAADNADVLRAAAEYVEGSWRV
jgi:hypothetical protein